MGRPQGHRCRRHRRFHPSRLVRRAQAKAGPRRARPLPPARRHRAGGGADAAAGVPHAGAVHARGGNLDHLQEGRPYPQSPSPALCARFRDRRSPVGTAGAYRQHRLRRPTYSRTRFPRSAGDRARSRSPRLSGAGTYLDAVVRGARIFAVETGLSSDPAMNWRVSFLDRYRLTSSSDAHSPGKLGREATIFDCERDYFAIKHALESGHGYVGTVEFFPEEGKYHLDGHRKCEVRLSPKETLAHGGLCPVCGQPLTIGVEHRVEVLADRSDAQAAPPPTAGAVSSLVPLPEILSELTATGTASRAVAHGYDQAIAKLGPELSILQSVPVDDIAHAGSAILAEAITLLRSGHVIRDAGYDGEYGVIRLFEENELRRLTGGAMLFDTPVSKRKPAEAVKVVAPPSSVATDDAPVKSARPRLRVVSDRTSSTVSGILAQLDEDQRAAAGIVDGPLLIVAGPGSGKTRTLTCRIAHLVSERGAAAESCLAITFTRRAAGEMRERLARLLPNSTDKVAIHTFNSLGLAILREHGTAAGLGRDFRVASETERIELLAAMLELSAHKAERLLRGISREKRTQSWAGSEVTEARAAYSRAMALRNWIDFDDLVALAVRVLMSDPHIAELYRGRWRWISVDEFQDVDEQQYRLLTLLAPPDGNLCAIGAPNQAIYGFRGADASCFDRFRQDYPAVRTVRLARNYRSTGTIVSASSQVIAPRPNEQ